MSLIALLIALVIDRNAGSLTGLRNFGWFDRITHGIRTSLPDGEYWQGPVAVVFVVGFPVVLLAWLAAVLYGIWGLFGFVFAVFVLLWSLGPAGLEERVTAYSEARGRGDDEAAAWYATELLGDVVPDDPEARSEAMIDAVLVGVHERILGVFFWFVLLGPAGALIWRFTTHLDRGAIDGIFGDSVRRLHWILAWVPARLTALAFALSGSFVEAVGRWRQTCPRGAAPAADVLVAAGRGALQMDGTRNDTTEELEDLESTVSLARRSVYIWFVVLALFTIAGWVA